MFSGPSIVVKIGLSLYTLKTMILILVFFIIVEFCPSTKYPKFHNEGRNSSIIKNTSTKFFVVLGLRPILTEN